MQYSRFNILCELSKNACTRFVLCKCFSMPCESALFHFPLDCFKTNSIDTDRKNLGSKGHNKLIMLVCNTQKNVVPNPLRH